MTDTHCHLDLCEDTSAAADPDLRFMVSVGINVERSNTTLELTETYANVYAAVGIHPNNASDAKDAAIRESIEKFAQQDKVVAIGETGFDTYWDDEPLTTQRESFLWQAELANRLDKALILHVRDKKGEEISSLESAQMIQQAGHPRGILHCCNGHQKLIDVGLELGWYVSFAGNLTYKNAHDLHEAAKHIPRDRLLVETDSPFLTPVPHRGKRNVPGNVRHTAAFLAELRGDTLEEVEAYTDENAARIYRIEGL